MTLTVVRWSVPQPGLLRTRSAGDNHAYLEPRRIEVELKGINTKCSNKSVADALKKSGYKLLEKRVSWPRMKAVAAVRIDCATGHAVEFVAATNVRYLSTER